MDIFNWICPFCNHAQIVDTKQNRQYQKAQNFLPHYQSVPGPLMAETVSVQCVNDDCREIQLVFALFKAVEKAGYSRKGKLIQSWRLWPDSLAKPQPDYIPKHIVEDYAEACRICDLSPKASATLARRCVQEMIRDFCNIKETNLYSEIEELGRRVEKGDGPKHVAEETISALHVVRKFGNIGAHMKKGAGVIIDVEPEEAKKLIELIELLFHEWYVQRHERAQKLQDLQAMNDD